MKVLHLDMDSFFATVEQQARPSLRGRAVGITMVNAPGGTIVAASIEAKRFGVKTGTKVAEAKALIPDITLLPPTPEKYRAIHRRFRDIAGSYPGTLKPRSIDEVSLWLDDIRQDDRSAWDIGAEIKQRIRDEVGEWVSSSVGIGPNWLLAKTASNLDKPNGLFEIDERNIRDVLSRLKLRDLCGIATKMEARLNLAGYASPLDLYDADPWELKRKLGLIGYYWHRRLHGLSIDTEQWDTKSIGHSSVIPRPSRDLNQIRPVFHKLCQRAGRRLRGGGWQAARVGTGGQLADRSGWYWHTRPVAPFTDTNTLFKFAWGLLEAHPPPAPLRVVALRMTDLIPANPEQLSLWESDRRRQGLVAALDHVNDRWGEHTVQPAAMLGAEAADDSIAFGQDMTTARE